MPIGDVKTVRVVLSPDSVNTPLTLWYQAVIKLDAASELKVKKKAYGLLIRGPKESVDRTTSALRKIDPNRIFIMECAPSVKTHKIFRGFLQLSGEIQTLPLISEALEDSSNMGSKPKITCKLIRCRYKMVDRFTGSDPADRDALVIDALVIDRGGGNVEVICPEMMLSGVVICNDCPYGKLTYWA